MTLLSCAVLGIEDEEARELMRFIKLCSVFASVCRMQNENNKRGSANYLALLSICQEAYVRELYLIQSLTDCYRFMI